MIQASTSPSGNSVRLFIAVELPHDVKHELSRLQKIFEQRHLFVGSYPKPNVMHLTLKFIGDLPANRVPEIQKRLHGIRFNKLTAQLTKLALFGNPKTPKVLYVDIGCPGLIDLVHILDNALQDFCGSEEREFKGHLTVARVRQTIGGDALLQLINQTNVIPISFAIHHINLMQSKLNSEGPVHTIIERYELIS